MAVIFNTVLLFHLKTVDSLRPAKHSSSMGFREQSDVKIIRVTLVVKF